MLIVNSTETFPIESIFSIRIKQSVCRLCMYKCVCTHHISGNKDRSPAKRNNNHKRVETRTKAEWKDVIFTVPQSVIHWIPRRILNIEWNSSKWKSYFPVSYFICRFARFVWKSDIRSSSVCSVHFPVLHISVYIILNRNEKNEICRVNEHTHWPSKMSLSAVMFGIHAGRMDRNKYWSNACRFRFFSLLLLFILFVTGVAMFLLLRFFVCLANSYSLHWPAFTEISFRFFHRISGQI